MTAPGLYIPSKGRNAMTQTQTFIKPELVVWARERAGLSKAD